MKLQQQWWGLLRTCGWSLQILLLKCASERGDAAWARHGSVTVVPERPHAAWVRYGVREGSQVRCGLGRWVMTSLPADTWRG